MRVTFKKLILVGLLFVMPFVLSGCLLKLLFGFAVTSDIGEFVELAIEGEMNVALCTDEDVDGGTFVTCTYAFADGELSQTSTVKLISEFGILGVFLDPIILQVPADAYDFNGTFDDGTGSGPQPLGITEVTSFFADASTEVIPESGHKFIIVDFPPSVPPAITATNPLAGHPYSFQLEFRRLSFDPTELKAMYAGRIEINGNTFYPPMLPCTTDFSTIPSITIPFAASPQNLGGQILTALFSGDVAPCNEQVYDYTGATPPAREVDLSISKSDDSDPVVAGEALAYTLTITNNGPDSATSVVVEDILPAGVTIDVGSSSASCSESGGVVTCNVGDVAAGDTEIVTVGVIVDSSAVGTITNIASVSSEITDTDPSNDSASADTKILSSNRQFAIKGVIYNKNDPQKDTYYIYLDNCSDLGDATVALDTKTVRVQVGPSSMEIPGDEFVLLTSGYYQYYKPAKKAGEELHKVRLFPNSEGVFLYRANTILDGIANPVAVNVEINGWNCENTGNWRELTYSRGTKLTYP